jgi:hypothetical protein
MSDDDRIAKAVDDYRTWLLASMEALHDSNRTADWDYHRALDDVAELLGGATAGHAEQRGGA